MFVTEMSRFEHDARIPPIERLLTEANDTISLQKTKSRSFRMIDENVKTVANIFAVHFFCTLLGPFVSKKGQLLRSKSSKMR